MKSIYLSIVIFTTLLSNCQEEVQSSDIVKIEYGTSFGMCLGYCIKTLSIESDQARKTLSSRDENQKTLSCNIEVEASSIFTKVNTREFNDLPDIIGCPDCADGGSEWIEITTSSGSKKVTYEFQKEPKEVASYIQDLRLLFDELGECE